MQLNAAEAFPNALRNRRNATQYPRKAPRRAEAPRREPHSTAPSSGARRSRSKEPKQEAAEALGGPRRLARGAPRPKPGAGETSKAERAPRGPIRLCRSGRRNRCRLSGAKGLCLLSPLPTEKRLGGFGLLSGARRAGTAARSSWCRRASSVRAVIMDRSALGQKRGAQRIGATDRFRSASQRVRTSVWGGGAAPGPPAGAGAKCGEVLISSSSVLPSAGRRVIAAFFRGMIVLSLPPQAQDLAEAGISAFVGSAAVGPRIRFSSRGV